jgi:hypothetical protein
MSAPREPVMSAPRELPTSTPRESAMSAPREQVMSAPWELVTFAPWEPETSAPREPLTSPTSGPEAVQQREIPATTVPTLPSNSNSDFPGSLVIHLQRNPDGIISKHRSVLQEEHLERPAPIVAFSTVHLYRVLILMRTLLQLHRILIEIAAALELPSMLQARIHDWVFDGKFFGESYLRSGNSFCQHHKQEPNPLCVYK